MMLSSFSVITLFFTAHFVRAFNFPYESIQLKDSDVGNSSDIAFGKLPVEEAPRCKSYPGYEGWPLPERWSAFNLSLGGSLIRGIPPAATCYKGEYEDMERCADVRRRQGDALFAYAHVKSTFTTSS